MQRYIKRYVHLVRLGLPWSISTLLLYSCFEYYRYYAFARLYVYVTNAVIFILIGGPLYWTLFYTLCKKLTKKK